MTCTGPGMVVQTCIPCNGFGKVRGQGLDHIPRSFWKRNKTSFVTDSSEFRAPSHDQTFFPKETPRRHENLWSYSWAYRSIPWNSTAGCPAVCTQKLSQSELGECTRRSLDWTTIVGRGHRNPKVLSGSFRQHWFGNVPLYITSTQLHSPRKPSRRPSRVPQLKGHFQVHSKQRKVTSPSIQSNSKLSPLVK